MVAEMHALVYVREAVMESLKLVLLMVAIVMDAQVDAEEGAKAAVVTVQLFVPMDAILAVVTDVIHQVIRIADIVLHLAPIIAEALVPEHVLVDVQMDALTVAKDVMDAEVVIVPDIALLHVAVVLLHAKIRVVQIVLDALYYVPGLRFLRQSGNKG